MAATHLVMNTPALKRVLWLQQKSRVVINSPRLPQMDRSSAQERMNRWLGVSGYGFGLAATVAALVLCILWVGGHWQFFVRHFSITTGLGTTACLVAGMIGRTLGFLYARWRLARVIWLVAAQMNDFGTSTPAIGSRTAPCLINEPITQ